MGALRHVPHNKNNSPNDLFVQAGLVSKVIIHRSHVGACLSAYITDGNVLEATLGEEARSRVQETMAGLLIVGSGFFGQFQSLFAQSKPLYETVVYNKRFNPVKQKVVLFLDFYKSFIVNYLWH
jgi:hypothetical protein